MTSHHTPPSSTPEPGAFTRSEILSQAESWRGAVSASEAARAGIETLFASHRDQPVVFVGCGSPYYLGQSAAAAYRASTGQWAVAAPASEILFNLNSVIPAKAAPFAIAVSRSGETSELLAACRRLKEQRGSPILAITVTSGTSLTKLADTNVLIPDASERSMAQTRSFSAMLLATLGTIAIVAGNQSTSTELQRVPALAQAYLDRIQQPISDLIERGFERVFFLGSGLRYGLANEGSLKMKEMSITNSEPFHFLEFRHGPQSMVDERTLAVGLVSQHAYDAETKVLREMLALGGAVIAIHPGSAARYEAGFVDIEMPPGLSEIAQLPFYMPVLHLLAYNQAMRKGLDCDSPRNLRPWIQLPELESGEAASQTRS